MKYMNGNERSYKIKIRLRITRKATNVLIVLFVASVSINISFVNIIYHRPS